jgi:maleate isomerase
MSRQPSPATRERICGHRARIGYTSPPLTAEIVPFEFYKIVPDGVTLVIATLAITEVSQAEIETSYAISLKAARAMADAGVDIVVLGGVPINLSGGYANARAAIGALEAELGVKVSTSASAQEHAVHRLGCRKVVVAHPYGAGEEARQCRYAEQYGCEVLGAAGWGSTLPQFGSIPRDAALELGRALLRRHPQADAILFPSPHWPATSAIEPLEREFGVTVVTALQAAVWDALRRVGVDDRIARYGRLFSEF